MPRIKKVRELEIEPIEMVSVATGDPYPTTRRYDVEEQIPEPTDFGWTDYVISQLEEEEIWSGIPRIDGLRRLVEKLICPIVEVRSHISSIVSEYPTIVCTSRIVLANGRAYEASADAHSTSVANEYRNRLTAVAENRALSRVYRMALRLGNIVSDADVSSMNDLSSQEPIIPSQINIINKLLPSCENVSLPKLIEYILGPNKKLESLRFSEAAKIIQALSDYKNKRSDIPEELKGE